MIFILSRYIIHQSTSRFFQSSRLHPHPHSAPAPPLQLRYKTTTIMSQSTTSNDTCTSTPTSVPTPTPSPPPIKGQAPPLHLAHSHSSHVHMHSHYEFHPHPIPLVTALTAISPSPQSAISPLSASALTPTSNPSSFTSTPTDASDTCTSPRTATETDETPTTSMITHKFRVACLQLNTGDDIIQNVITTSALIRRAATEGAQLIVTPENTGRMSATVQKTGIDVRLAYYEEDHPALHAYRELASELNVWILIGSLAVRTRHDQTRLVNRSFLLAPASFALKPHSTAARMAYQLQTTTHSHTTTPGTQTPFILRTSSSSDLTLAHPPIHHHTQSASISLTDPMSTLSVSSSGAVSPHRSDSPTSMAQDDTDSPTSSLPSSIQPSPSIIDRSPGHIICRYDKIHMFDVPSLNASQGESYHESMRIRPGQHAVLCQTPWGNIGMTICYDLRFPHLYRCLAQQGAYFLSIPAAFTRITGEAHWHILLRARAIETGCYVFAPAQCGIHPGQRKTYGHTLIISPWGEILADAGPDQVGYVIADIDTAQVMSARSRVPSLMHDRPFDLQICDI